MNTDFNYTEEDFKGMFGASEDDGILDNIVLSSVCTSCFFTSDSKRENTSSIFLVSAILCIKIFYLNSKSPLFAYRYMTFC